MSSNMTDVSGVSREQRSPPGEPARETPRDAADREDKHDESDELICHVSTPFFSAPFVYGPDMTASSIGATLATPNVQEGGSLAGNESSSVSSTRRVVARCWISSNFEVRVIVVIRSPLQMH